MGTLPRLTSTVLGCLMLIPCTALGVTLSPTADSGLRLYDGGTPIVLTFDSVKPGPSMEDRTVMEFYVGDLVGTVSTANLTTYWANIDTTTNSTDGTLSVYVFNGDGVVTATDWDAGVLLETKIHNNSSSPFVVDVTEAVQNALDFNWDYFGIGFRTTSQDRFNGWDLSFVAPQYEPRLEILGVTQDTSPVPEPTTLLLLGSGLVGLAGYGRKQKK